MHADSHTRPTASAATPALPRALAVRCSGWLCADRCVAPCAVCSRQCEWTIRCGPAYSHVSLLFSRVETEEDYDVVAVFEGDQQSNAAELSRLSGHNIPPTTVETAGRTALIQFVSDEDVAGAWLACLLSAWVLSACLFAWLRVIPSLLSSPCPLARTPADSRVARCWCAQTSGLRCPTTA